MPLKKRGKIRLMECIKRLFTFSCICLFSTGVAFAQKDNPSIMKSRTLAKQGKQFYDAGRYDSAIFYFNGAIKLFPGDANYYFFRANAKKRSEKER